eukprot:7859504-Karenia_brevis.AAC.1
MKLDESTRIALNGTKLSLFSPLTRAQRQALAQNNLSFKATRFHGHTSLKCHPVVMNLRANMLA